MRFRSSTKEPGFEMCRRFVYAVFEDSCGPLARHMLSVQLTPISGILAPENVHQQQNRLRALRKVSGPHLAPGTQKAVANLATAFGLC
jgi:hypothetical protein